MKIQHSRNPQTSGDFTTELNLARKLYAQPDFNRLTKSLPSMGAALASACCSLSQDATLGRADELLSTIEGARVAVQQIRRRLAKGKPPC
jgi:hypothetical protein